MRAPLFAAALTLACSTRPAEDGASARRDGAAHDHTPAALDLSHAGAWPEPYASDPLWARAASGDALARHTLAQREGAVGLTSALERGGQLGRTALETLPHASDADLAMAPLCRALEHAQPPTRGWLLEALHAIVARAPDDPETRALTATARDDCRARLRSLVERAEVAPAERDLASSAHSLLDPAVTAAGPR